MIVLHSNCQLSHLHLSFAPSPQMWPEHHTVCLRSHRTSPMFSKCGALLLMNAVLQISGVTGVPRWNGAPVGEILLAHCGTWMELLSFVVLQFFPHHVSVLGNSRRDGWQGFYAVLSVPLLFLLGLMCYLERWEMFKRLKTSRHNTNVFIYLRCY